ncbi:asparagine synthase-related protein [Streptomyces griseoviridis]
MTNEWAAGGTVAEARGAPIDGFDGVRYGGGRVRQVGGGMSRLALLGDSAVDERGLAGALPAVAAGRWEELTRWPGSYWVIARNATAVFVCGDLAGIRPVYYSPRGGPGRWATDSRRLGQPLVPDLPWLTAQLVVGAQHWPDRTPHEDVRLVPGGFGLLLTADGQLQIVDVSGIVKAADLRSGAAAFGQALTDAIRHRVVAADGRASADLSGGLDSSTAVLLAAESGDVHAVTYTDAYTSAEDTSFAQRVADRAGVRHTLTRGGPQQLPFRFPAAERAGCEPVLAHANWPMDSAYLDAVAGLPLHLTGHGGDVVLDASTACWVRLLQDGHLRAAHREVVAFARLRSIAPGGYWRAVKEAASLGHTGTVERVADDLDRRRAAPRAVGGWSWCRPGPSAAWLTEEGRQHVAALLRQAARTQEHTRADEFDQWSALRAMGSSARGWLPCAAALALRPVHPYLDNQVVRAAFAVPALARRGVTTYKPLLPAALPRLPGWLTSRRSKGSFTAQRIAGLDRHHSRLREVIGASPLVASGLIDAASAHTALAQAARGQNPSVIPDVHQLLVICWWLSERRVAWETAC